MLRCVAYATRAITKGATDRKRYDTFAALFVDLDGPLDRLNALELISRIKEAVNQARKDIVVNFEHLKLVTLDALTALVDSDAMEECIILNIDMANSIANRYRSAGLRKRSARHVISTATQPSFVISGPMMEPSRASLM